MTSIFNYIATIALAIVVAAGAALVYVLYTHFTQTPTTTATTPSITTAPPNAQTTTPPPTTQPPTATTSPNQRSTVDSVILYIVTPKVKRCSIGGSEEYIYYFNVTMRRMRIEDPISFHVFKARAGNATLNLTGAYYLNEHNTEFFKSYYSIDMTKLGLVNVYLEIITDKSLNITAVEYRPNNEYLLYNIGGDRIVYVSCIKQIVIVNATNGNRLTTAFGPGSLGLIPAGAKYTINVTLPPGRYRLSPPGDVKVEPDVVEGGKPQILTIKLQENKPQVYDPLVINATRID